jgi:hypothetical protein
MTTEQHPVDRAPQTTTTSWATGLARFGGVAMVVLGILHVVAGTGALFTGEITVVGVHNAFLINITTWGWVHLVGGILVALVGMSVITGQLWARVIAIALVSVSLVVSFLSLAQHPARTIIAIGLAVAVIWALCVFDEETSAASPTMLD